MKTIFEKMFGQYRGMRRELYILFWGKAATNMGAMIWPMLTLILSNKLGMNAPGDRQDHHSYGSGTVSCKPAGRKAGRLLQ